MAEEKKKKEVQKHFVEILEVKITFLFIIQINFLGRAQRTQPIQANAYISLILNEFCECGLMQFR